MHMDGYDYIVDRMTEQNIKAFLAKHPADDKVPSAVIFVDDIPRTHTGKILKRKLQER